MFVCPAESFAGTVFCNYKWGGSDRTRIMAPNECIPATCPVWSTFCSGIVKSHLSCLKIIQAVRALDPDAEV